MSAPASSPVASPWWTLKEAAAYLRKSEKYLRREIALGRLKAARIGSSRMVLTCAAWCDAWVASQAEVKMVRPAGPRAV